MSDEAREGASAIAPLTDDEIVALGEGRVVVRDGVLGLELARACADGLARRIEDLVPAGVGRDHVRDRSIRGDAITWVDRAEDPASRALWAWFDALREELNRSCWLGLVRFSVQVARFPGDGTGYAPHRDALVGAANRRVTAIVYLNEGWRPEHGGALHVREPGGLDREILPELDRLVLFLSDRVEHEVRPAFRERWAVTAWYRGAEGIPVLDDA